MKHVLSVFCLTVATAVASVSFPTPVDVVNNLANANDTGTLLQSAGDGQAQRFTTDEFPRVLRSITVSVDNFNSPATSTARLELWSNSGGSRGR